MSKHLVLIGGGHAHMVTLANIRRFMENGHKVTVIGPSGHHYYSGMGPGMLGNTYTPDDIRFATRHLVEKQGGRFVLSKVNRIDAEAQTLYLDSGDTVDYDVLSCNAGSYVPAPEADGDFNDIYPVKPIDVLIAAQSRLVHLMKDRTINIGIAGGGPSSAEIAGNIWGLARDQGLKTPEIRIFSGHRFMSRFPAGVRRRVMKSLTGRGIHIDEERFVERIEGGTIVLASGERHALDIIFLALGVKPSAIFSASGLPIGPDGGLLVNQFLQSTGYPNIFGGGDCIYFKDQPLDKVGVYAVRENPVLYHNLMAWLEGKALMPFDPGGDYLLIFNLGGGTGVLRKRWLQFGGRLAFAIKNYIDIKFMKKYQAFE